MHRTRDNYDDTIVNASLRLGRKVLAHPTRIKMLGLLGSEPRTLEQLQRTIGIRRKEALFHIRKLNEENVLDRTDLDKPSADVEAVFALKPGVRGLILTLGDYADATAGRPDV